ncbi:phosphoglycerate kinase, chloroplastic-like [Dorcoceras hygrometricum]|uniref:Phosphoglycerate kinase, chloroplastic-like n=1 Tax=Dorcoceras hygrometricum TaxID=472368 RepID=A0A2Z7A916_9LAMI|nr:phosphoglycerate kinase, chloroplastic-like [Dorcoceras hygrometricum]
MMFRVVRTNQYNQDLGLIHSTNGNHLESPNEGSSIDNQVTIYLHAQNITMFPIKKHEHVEPLGSLGLDGAGDDPVDEFILTVVDDL